MTSYSQAPSAPRDETVEALGLGNVEVGLLANEKATEPEEVSLEGFLAVLGKDKNPSKSTIAGDGSQTPVVLVALNRKHKD